MKPRFLWRWFSSLLLLSSVFGYDIATNIGGFPITWNPGTVTMKLLLNTTPVLSDGSNYVTSVQAAMQTWNSHISTVQFASDPGAPASPVNNGVNEVAIDSTVYGTAFDANVLAITVSYYSSNGRADGSFPRVQSDVIFNSVYTWDSYRGSLRSSQDIQRVALHELGHALGLKHPDTASPPQSVTAQMNSHVTNLDTLAPDDIAGIQVLYGAAANPVLKPDRGADFDGDGKADLVWSNNLTGDRSMWLMNGSVVKAGASLGTVPVAWVISATGDFDGDGKTDLFWTNTTTGDRTIWLMDGSVMRTNAFMGTVPVAWKVSGSGDFDGDGKSDLVWTNTVTGDRAMWLLNGTTVSGGGYLGTVPVAWTISGVGDFNGDGKADLVWSNTITGERSMWFQNGSTTIGGAMLNTVPVAWVISGVGDFNGDGKADIFLTNTTSGDRVIWLMNGSTITTNAFMGTIPVDWTISGTGDFNGDGKKDLVWTNTTTGDRAMWLLNGSTVTGGGYLGTVPVAWKINN